MKRKQCAAIRSFTEPIRLGTQKTTEKRDLPPKLDGLVTPSGYETSLVFSDGNGQFETSSES